MSGVNPECLTLLRTVIQATGLARRKAFAAIREGRVTCDGQAVTDPSALYRGGALTLEGRPLAAPIPAKIYLMLNKPAGVISATTDPHGRPTVLDLVPVELRLPGLHPVGRLDQDTTGLLLLTNDGDFTFHLTHPRHEVEKEYWFSSRPPLTEHALRRLRAGFEIDGRVRRPVEARHLPASNGYETAIVLREGRKRQVRRMVELAGAKVLRLTRVREDGVSLGTLPEGAVRELTSREVSALLGQGGPRSSSRASDATAPARQSQNTKRARRQASRHKASR